MPQTVKVGNDTLTFPDGMADADIKAAIDKEYGGAKNQIPNPPSVAPLRANEGTGFIKGAFTPIDNASVWMKNGMDKLGIDTSPTGVLAKMGAAIRSVQPAGLNRFIDNPKTLVTDAAARGEKPGLIGQIAGNTVTGLPVLMATKNPWLAGAGLGALNTSDPNSGAQTAIDTGIGGLTGGVGNKVIGGIGKVISPKINPLVKKLLDEGVQLTPGQVAGGMLHRIEDATRSIYGLGDMVIGAQANAQKSLNRAAVQRTVSDLGIQIPKDLPEGHAQIGFAQKTLGDAYTKVLDNIDHVTAPTGSTLPVPPGGGPRPGIHLDNQFGQEVANLRQMARNLPQDQAHVFESFVQGDMRHAIQPNGSISGKAMKDLDSLIGQKIRNFQSSPNPHDRDMGQAFKELQANLRDMVGRQFPQHKATLDAINSGWAQLTRLEPIAANAEGGVFTAPALRAGTVAADKTVRHRASARGEALMQDLGDAASRVMHATVPDSGTPARALATGAAGYALFGNPIHGIHVNPWAASALGALSLPYMNKTTGALTRAAMTARPAGAAAVRSMVDRFKHLGTVAGVNMGQSQEPGH
jgi:hypothetical protein